MAFVKLLTFALVFQQAAVALGTANGTLRIGGPIQKTGKYGTVGLNAIKAFEMWRDWTVNRSYTVELNFQDATTSDAAITIAKSMVDGDQVDILVVPYLSSISEAVVNALNYTSTPIMVWGGASASIFTQAERAPNAFGTFTSAAKYMDSGLTLLKAQGATTVMLIKNAKSFSTSVCDGAKAKAEALGYTVSGEASVANDGSDVASVLAGQSVTAVDVLVVCGHADDVQALVTHLSSSKVVPQAVLATQVATSTFRSAMTSASNADKLCGLMMPSQWDSTQAGVADPVVGWTPASFTSAYTSYAGSSPTYHTASAAAVGVALANAIEAGSEATTDVSQIVTNLNALDINSFYGQIKFATNGQMDGKLMVTVQNRPDDSVKVVAPAAQKTGDVNYPGATGCPTPAPSPSPLPPPSSTDNALGARYSMLAFMLCVFGAGSW